MCDGCWKTRCGCTKWVMWRGRRVMSRSSGGSGAGFMWVTRWWGRPARQHVMSAEWDEECSIQQWQSNGELWWSKWAEEMEAMSDNIDGAWIPDEKAGNNGAVNVMSAGQKEQCCKVVVGHDPDAMCHTCRNSGGSAGREKNSVSDGKCKT